MAATATVDTVGVDRKLLIRMIAELSAAAEIVSAITDEEVDDDAICDHFWGVSDELRENAFGSIYPMTDEEFDTDPVSVEVGAKSREIASHVLQMHFTPKIVRQLQERATQIREKGTTT